MKLPFIKNETKLIVLNYHGLVKENPLRFNSKFITVSEFERHLRFFKENCYVLSLSESKDKKNWKLNKLNIVLTFDDGYKNNYKYVLPLLQKYDFPATFCVTTSYDNKILAADLLDISANLFPNREINFNGKKWFLKQDKSHLKKSDEIKIEKLIESLSDIYNQIVNDKTLSDYWELMNKEELNILANNKLIELVPHGNTHCSLIQASNDNAQIEINESIKNIEDITSKKVKTFCYPYGEYNDFTENTLRDKGISKQLVVDYNSKKDVFKKDIVPRFAINPHISFNLQMRFIYKGRYF